MQERYGEQVLVNLLGSKEGERMLSLNFQVNTSYTSLQPLNIVFDNNAKTVQISACPRMISQLKPVEKSLLFKLINLKICWM